MKIAALYDIHGNLPALEAVLQELDKLQPDLIVVGGDIISGPMPAQTLERLIQLGERVRFIRGNGDREVVTAFDAQPLAADASEELVKEAHWIAGQLTRSQRDFLAALPEQFVVELAGLGSLLFCHATVRNDEEIFTPASPDEQLDEIFAGVTQDIVICGHTHIQFERHVGQLRVVNAGSVGMPFADQPGAYWLLLSPDGYTFQRTAYDLASAAQAIRASGNPQTEEFASENVLTVPSAAAAAEIFERFAASRRQASAE